MTKRAAMLAAVEALERAEIAMTWVPADRRPSLESALSLLRSALGEGEGPRAVTAKEDRWLRLAVRSSGTLVADGKLASPITADKGSAAIRRKD